MKVEIIAEVANAHQGNPDLALKLATEAVAAGADAVKFQVYFAEELLVRAHPRFEHFRKQSFGPEVWERLIPAVKALGAKVYCDVFGVEALAVAARLGADGFKVHSSDLGNKPLLQALAGRESRLFLSAGGSSAREIAYALDLLGTKGSRPVLLHGYQSYPTAVEDSALARLGWLAQLFGERCDIGYMDHVAGDDPFAVTLPVMAVGMGARVIEKHVTFDRAAQGVDWYSSIEPAEFKDFVVAVRRAEAAIGGRPDRFTPSERTYRATVKKHWVTARALPLGHLLTPSDLVNKRVADAKGDAVEMEKLVGRPLSQAVSEEEPLTRAHVENKTWAVVVARMRSSRLPGKALLDMAGQPALVHLFERLKQCRRVDRVLFCTTTLAEDDALARLAGHCGITCHRGPVDDVLARMLGGLDGQEVDLLLRVTGDDILVDPDYADMAVDHHLATNAEYSDLKALPSGTEVEVFDVALLRTIYQLCRDSGGTEYLTTYVVDNKDQFRTATVPVPDAHAHDWRLTLDTEEDCEVVRRFLVAMRDSGKALTYRLDDVVAWFKAHPEVLAINSMVRQRSTPPQVNTEMNWRSLA
jgi:N,N'-diacetyllegionaminate synthase